MIWWDIVLGVRAKLWRMQRSKIIRSAAEIREQADYEDFFVVNRQDVRKQIEKAEVFLSLVKEYLEKESRP